jgi:CRP-like cAMP-binding protein
MAGETVGEMALISGKPRNATVIALRDSELGRLSRAAFERLMVLHPQGLLCI